MVTPVLGSIGTQLNLLIKQGSTLGPFEVTLTNPDTTPIVLSGCQIRGQIRKKALDPVVVAALTVTSAYDGTGTFAFGMPAAETTALPAGELLTDPISHAVWDMELQDSTGRITPLYYGAVTVFREVTRA